MNRRPPIPHKAFFPLFARELIYHQASKGFIESPGRRVVGEHAYKHGRHLFSLKVLSGGTQELSPHPSAMVCRQDIDHFQFSLIPLRRVGCDVADSKADHGSVLGAEDTVGEDPILWHWWEARMDFEGQDLRNRLHASVTAYSREDWFVWQWFLSEVFEPNPALHVARFNEMVSGYWLGREEAWLIRKPIRLERDEGDRLHSAEGRCLEYRDGWGAYGWRGVHVPDIIRTHALARARRAMLWVFPPPACAGSTKPPTARSKSIARQIGRDHCATASRRRSVCRPWRNCHFGKAPELCQPVLGYW